VPPTFRISSTPPRTLMLHARGLYKAYGHRPILHNASFTVQKGSMTMLLGANGAGKTTLLRLIAGLEPVCQGQLERHCSEAELGYIGHGSFIYPHLTALENLHFWGTLYKKNTKTAHLLSMLERFNLGHVAYDLAKTFSRGMAQRLSLARLILLEPQFVLLDEPSTGLDTASQTLLHTIITDIHEKGATILWVSHNPERDAAHADTLLTLEKGRIETIQNASPLARQLI